MLSRQAFVNQKLVGYYKEVEVDLFGARFLSPQTINVYVGEIKSGADFKAAIEPLLIRFALMDVAFQRILIDDEDIAVTYMGLVVTLATQWPMATDSMVQEIISEQKLNLDPAKVKIDVMSAV